MSEFDFGDHTGDHTGGHTGDHTGDHHQQDEHLGLTGSGVHGHDGPFGWADQEPGLLGSGLADTGLGSWGYDRGSAAHIIGTPATDEAYWHHQAYDNTCAVVAQRSVIESLTGQHLSEDALRAEAMAHGWYTTSGGTPMADVGALLEAHGIPVQRETGASLLDIEHQLAAGNKVIVGINGEDVWNNAHPAGESLPLGSYPGIPGQVADHAVEVIGVDVSDPAAPMVILNDSGTPTGRGEEVPASVFEEAWAASGDFMVHTSAMGGPVTGTVTQTGTGTQADTGALGDSSGINEDTGNPVEAWGEHYYDTRTWDQVTPK